MSDKKLIKKYIIYLMENNNITINIPYKSHLANILTYYAATFDNIDNFICDSFTKENND